MEVLIIGLCLIGAFWIILGVRLFTLQREDTMRFVKKSGKSYSNTAFVIIPGFMPPDYDKFADYLEDLEGDVYLYSYSLMCWREKEFCDSILHDLLLYDYDKITIISISLGSKMAYSLRERLITLYPKLVMSSKKEGFSVDSIMVNPAIRGRMLKKSIRIPLIFLLPIVMFLAVGVFWPIMVNLDFEIDGVKHDLRDTLTQLWALVYDSRKCVIGTDVQNREVLVLSRNDRLIDNAAVYNAIAPNSPTVIKMADFKHGDICDPKCYKGIMSLVRMLNPDASR